jgi:cation diffusion facilitator family transporter
MSNFYDVPFGSSHDHVFLGEGHDKNARKTWWVIGLAATMMIVEIVGGTLFGSLALVADGMHMSTHAGAMLIAALAYTYARKHAHDPRFVFGTGKLGDLAGFTSAIILAMIALIIGYESVLRFMSPVPIHFGEAIPIAVVGLLVNVASAWLLSGDDHHGHSHGHGHGDHDDHAEHAHDDERKEFQAVAGACSLAIAEETGPAVFRLETIAKNADFLKQAIVTTVRPDGTRQEFAFAGAGNAWQSTTTIPEPHEFTAVVRIGSDTHSLVLEEHGHSDGAGGVDTRDHNMRAAYLHILADAAVSVLAIVGLVLAKIFGWLWMDPLAGIVGALVIANWSFGLIRDTGAILVDLNKDDSLARKVRKAVESGGDVLVDLHVWRLGPGHFSAVAAVETNAQAHDTRFYHQLLRSIPGLSHVTVEVQHAGGH